MKKIIGRIIITGCLALSITSVSGMIEEADDHPASSRYLLAYNTMEMADWLAGRDMFEDAKELYKEALAGFQEVAAQYPDWESRLVGYRIDYCRGQLEAIDLPTATHVEKCRFEEVAQKALRLERIPDPKRALALYSEILKHEPKHLQALKGAARCHLRMGSIDGARKLLGKGVPPNTSDSELLLLMALVESYDQQFERAIQLLRVAIDDNRMNADAYVAMGVALAGLGRLDAASNEMKRALSLNSRISEAYYNLAWISLRQNPGNLALVRTHYDNALRYGAEPDPLLERLFR